MKHAKHFFVAAWVCLMGMLAAVSGPVAEAADEAKPKILFLTHSAGFKHSSLGTAEKVFTKIGKESGVYEPVVLEGYKQDQKEIDLSMLTKEYLDQFDAVMFFTTGELPLTDDQKQALLDFVLVDGKAWIGAHSATDTFYKWPEYMENFSGGYFKTHGANNAALILKVEDTEHPATEMLGEEWELADEFYQYREGSFDPKRSHVLISVDTEKSKPLRMKANRMEKGNYYPLAWCREAGKGRSFYTALGHREDVWENAKFQAHLLGGIEWALGLKDGDATPSAELK